MFPSPVSVAVSHRKRRRPFWLLPSDIKSATVTGMPTAVDMGYRRAPELSLNTASLLRVNKQIYKEALPILYANATFSAPASPVSMLHFIDRLSEHARSQVRRIRIHVWSLLLSESLVSGQESLKWTVLCSQVANFNELNIVEVIYPSADFLRQGSVEFHWRRYANALSLVPGKKVLLIYSSDLGLYHAACEQLRARFDEIQNFKRK